MSDTSKRFEIDGDPVMPDHGAPPPGPGAYVCVTHYVRFAERVLPTLQRIRRIRLAAQALSASGTTPQAMRIGGYVLEAILRIDKTLRSTGVYELSHVNALENDPVGMEAISRILDAVAAHLATLASQVVQRAQSSSGAAGALPRTAASARSGEAVDPNALSEFVELLAALRAPPAPPAA